MRRHEGFTLIEILLAVGLTGIIAVASLVPLVFTVQSLETVQKGWGKDVKVMEAAERIFRDTRNFAQCGPFPVFRIVHKEGLTIREDDRLLIWSAAPVKENRAPGLVVYKIVSSSGLNKYKPGLYRWELPGWRPADGSDKETGPTALDTDNLRPEDGKMVLKDAEGLRLSVWSGESWSDEYTGELPKAMRITITLNGRKQVYEDSLPTILKE
ncbi:MAG TPA: prepilin-type N-terminal cleavage/methylation domain-containing protein [Synergistaceae bacterium]|jgi:prepilin-type N-terminal cleavage/methylation domain-containing protein|nr:prepilin-type N-terminal cleavage/methylation domain-containing protein [Synergistaceae bacterium]